MRLDNGLANGEAQTGAAIGARAGFISAIEAFEHVRKVFRGNALACVGHRNHCRTLFGTRLHADLPILAVVMDRVGQKIGLTMHVSEEAR